MMVTEARIKELIHESNLIEGYDDPAFDAKSLEAWHFLIAQDKLTAGVICRVQKLIVSQQADLEPEWRGKWRKIDVWVARRQCLSPKKIPQAMRKWTYYHLNRNAKEAHIEFETIHPFVDGNGRTGRMLMWWQEIREGRQPTMIMFEDRWDYYDWFNNARSVV